MRRGRLGTGGNQVLRRKLWKMFSVHGKPVGLKTKSPHICPFKFQTFIDLHFKIALIYARNVITQSFTQSEFIISVP